METLGRKDHDALVLRFFENKNFAEVGAALGAGADNARMRVNRALEKLRKFFTKRGVTLSSVAIAGAISANSVQAAPVALAKTVTAVAIAKGAAASASTLTLIKGALKIMAWTKMKTAIVVGVVVLLAVGGVTSVGVAMTYSNQAAAVKLLKQVEEKYASLESYTYDGEGLLEAHSHTNASTFSVRLARPCSYRTEELTARTETIEFIYGGMDNYSFSYFPKQTNILHQLQSTPDERLAHFDSLRLNAVIATCLPTYFFFNTNPSPFHLFSPTNNDLKISLLSDRTIGSTECHRLVLIVPGHQMRLTLWIGKPDHLIYQTEQWIENGESIGKTNFPAMLREIYRNIRMNVPFVNADFISDKIPASLKTSDKFP